MIEHCLPLPGRLEREWVLWVELWLRAVRHPALQDVAHELYARLHEWFAGAIAEGVERGEFEVADVDAATDVLLGAIDGIGVRVLAGDPALPLERARTLRARAGLARARRGGRVASCGQRRIPREMISRWMSEVPSSISSSLASRIHFSTGYSRE